MERQEEIHTTVWKKVPRNQVLTWRTCPKVVGDKWCVFKYYIREEHF